MRSLFDGVAVGWCVFAALASGIVAALVAAHNEERTIRAMLAADRPGA